MCVGLCVCVCVYIRYTPNSYWMLRVKIEWRYQVGCWWRLLLLCWVSIEPCNDAFTMGNWQIPIDCLRWTHSSYLWESSYLLTDLLCSTLSAARYHHHSLLTRPQGSTKTTLLCWIVCWTCSEPDLLTIKVCYCTGASTNYRPGLAFTNQMKIFTGPPKSEAIFSLS